MPRQIIIKRKEKPPSLKGYKSQVMGCIFGSVMACRGNEKKNV
jgi:hypothetical protein